MPPTDPNSNELHFSVNSLEEDLKAQPGQAGSISIPATTPPPTTPVTLPPIIDVSTLEAVTPPSPSPATDFSNLDIVAPMKSAWETTNITPDKSPAQAQIEQSSDSMADLVASEKNTSPNPTRFLLIGGGVFILLGIGGILLWLNRQGSTSPTAVNQPNPLTTTTNELTPLFAPPVEETDIVQQADQQANLDGTGEIIIEEIIELSTTTEPASPKASQPITSTKTTPNKTPALKASTSSLSALKSPAPETTNPTRTTPSAASWKLPELTKSLPVSDLTTEAVRQAWQMALRSQEPAGSLATIQLTYPSTSLRTGQQQPVPLALVLASLAQPTFIDRAYIDRFTQTLGPHYALLVFYTHSKRFPLLLIENSDPDAAQSFLQLWEKESLRSDLAPLSAPVSTAPYLRGYFVTKQTPQLTYRIAYRQDNTKLIWLLYNGSVVLSTTIAGLEQLPQIISNP